MPAKSKSGASKRGAGATAARRRPNKRQKPTPPPPPPPPASSGDAAGDADADSDAVSFITTHLNPQSVIWSSDENFLPVTVKPPWLIPESESPPKSELQSDDKTAYAGSAAAGSNDGGGNLFVIRMTECAPTAATATVTASAADPTTAALAAALKAAGAVVNHCDALLIVAGAGFGVDSGLPDYRSANGFWRNYPALAKLGLSLEDMSKTAWFETDPALAFGFYRHRAKLYAEAVPHTGFAILKQWASSAERMNGRCFVFTSNIDSQFERAGFDPDTQLYESHGSLAYLQCIKNCSGGKIWSRPPPATDGGDEPDPDTFRVPPESISKCKACGALSRPNVSFFSDSFQAFNKDRAHQQKARLIEFLTRASNRGHRLCVVETGCGRSIHSLRFETDELARAANPCAFHPDKPFTPPAQKPSAAASPLRAVSSGSGGGRGGSDGGDAMNVKRSDEFDQSQCTAQTTFDCVHVIRIDPDNAQVPPYSAGGNCNCNVGLQCGAKHALEQLSALLSGSK